jgi:hypothetical protein
MTYFVMDRHWNRDIYISRQVAEKFATIYSVKVRYATWQEVEDRFFPYHEHLVFDNEHWYEDENRFAYKDGDMVSFCDERGRRTTMRPGRFLTKFFPNLTKVQVEYWAQYHTKGVRPPDPSYGPTLFSEDFADIYDRGPDSCMAQTDYVRVYAAGDLQVAYLEKDGDVVARALCWPAKKAFGRVYPTPEEDEEDPDQDELQARLADLGWTSIYQDRSIFEGARILKIEDEFGDWVMPYIDKYHVEDAGEFFTLTRTSFLRCDSTSGYLQHKSKSCDNCSQRTLTATTVHFSSSSYEFCERCTENNSFYCNATERHYHTYYHSSQTHNGLTYHANHVPELEVA